MAKSELEPLTIVKERENRIILRPCIIVLMGLPLVGKTTLGKKLASATNCVLLDVENARYPDGLLKQPMPRGTEEVERSAMKVAYKRNHQQAADALRRDEPVILAATYSRPLYHQMLTTLSEETQREMVIFLITAPDEAIQDRIEERAYSESLSNIRSLHDYESVKTRYELPPFPYHHIDTRLDQDTCVEEILHALEPYMKNPPTCQVN